VKLKGYHYTSVANAEKIAAEGFDREYFGQFWGPGVYAALPDHIETRRSAYRHAAQRGRTYFQRKADWTTRLNLDHRHYRVAEIEVEVEVEDDRVLTVPLDSHGPVDTWWEENTLGEYNHDVLVCPTKCQRPLYPAYDCGQFVARHNFDVRVVGWRDCTNDPELDTRGGSYDDDEEE
jgi:hypothetical protein